MAKTKQQKGAELSALRETLAKQTAMYFVDYKGLKTDELTQLKKNLKLKDSKLVAVKKSLVNVLFKEKGIEFNPTELEGQVAIAFSFGDVFSPTKPIVDFSKTNKSLKVLGGCYMEEGKYHFLNVQEVVAYSAIPSREELLAQLAYVLNDTTASFARVLNAIKEKQETAPTA